MIDLPKILHPVVISQVMINFGVSLGLDAETCLLGTGIDQSVLQDPQGLIQPEQEMRLVENLILGLPDEPGLGFRLGLRYSVATFGSWGFALRTSRTLRDALRHAIRYLPLSTAYCRMHLLETGDRFGVVMDASDIPRHLRHFLLERDMATAVVLVRELSLTGLSGPQLTFNFPRPQHAEHIEKWCGASAHYSCEHNTLQVPRAEAEKPLPTFDAQLVRMLEDQCRLQLSRRQPSGTSGRVRTLLLGDLGLAAGIDEVAGTLAMSTRSLRRKLDAEGTTFSQLVEEERRQLAKQMLGDTNMTLEELAIHLGYSDAAGFTRAFRRWYGVSPGEYRKQASGGAADGC